MLGSCAEKSKSADGLWLSEGAHPKGLSDAGTLGRSENSNYRLKAILYIVLLTLCNKIITEY